MTRIHERNKLCWSNRRAFWVCFMTHASEIFFLHSPKHRHERQFSFSSFSFFYRCSLWSIRNQFFHWNLFFDKAFSVRNEASRRNQIPAQRARSLGKKPNSCSTQFSLDVIAHSNNDKCTQKELQLIRSSQRENTICWQSSKKRKKALEKDFVPLTICWHVENDKHEASIRYFSRLCSPS